MAGFRRRAERSGPEARQRHEDSLRALLRSGIPLHVSRLAGLLSRRRSCERRRCKGNCQAKSNNQCEELRHGVLSF
jgi:hypothetical protein